MNINIPLDRGILQVDDESNGDMTLTLYNLKTKWQPEVKKLVTIPKDQRCRLAEFCIGTNLILAGE